MYRRILSTLLVLCLVLGMLPGITWAVDGSVSQTVPENDTDTAESPVAAEKPLSGSEDLSYGSLKYQIKEGTVTITGCDCNAISITIPAQIDGLSVTSIGNNVFQYCSRLTDVYYTGSEAQWKAINIVEYNNALTSATIHYNSTGPDASTTTSGFCGENAFWKLENGKLIIWGTGPMTDYNYLTHKPWRDIYKDIKSVVIDTGITTIGDSAFSGCSNLAKVEIPGSVKSIGEYAFFDCKLTNVFIPDGVSTIKPGAFSTCTILTNITIPKSLTNIDHTAFSNCFELKDVYYSGSEIEWEKINVDIQNEFLTNATIHYNSTGPDDLSDGNLVWGNNPQQNLEVDKTITLTVCLADGSDIDASKLTWSLAPAHGTAEIIAQGQQDGKTSYVTLKGISQGIVTLYGTLAVGESVLDYPSVSQEITVIRQKQISDMYPDANSTVDLWANDNLTCSLTFTSEIEAGAGKIYLKDYSTDRVIKTIICDEYAADSFECNGNTLSISLISQLESPIPRGKKLYLTVDSDAVVIKNSSAFEGISNKDTWSFTTRYGLTQYRDRMNFLNKPEDFFEDYSTENSSYPISSVTLKSKLENIIGKKELKTRSEKEKEFGGACYGMSMVTALYKMGRLNLTKYDSEAANLYEMKKTKR